MGIRPLTDIERRVLRYLDQRGPTHRETVVCDLSSTDSMIGRRGGRVRGSNGATPLIMGRWCKALIDAGLVEYVWDRKSGTYRHHAITAAGRNFIRSAEAETLPPKAPAAETKETR